MNNLTKSTFNEIDALIWSMIITKFHIPSFLNTCKSDNIKEVTNNPKLYYIYTATCIKYICTYGKY